MFQMQDLLQEVGPEQSRVGLECGEEARLWMGSVCFSERQAGLRPWWGVTLLIFLCHCWPSCLSTCLYFVHHWLSFWPSSLAGLYWACLTCCMLAIVLGTGPPRCVRSYLPPFECTVCFCSLWIHFRLFRTLLVPIQPLCVSILALVHSPVHMLPLWRLFQPLAVELIMPPLPLGQLMLLQLLSPHLALYSSTIRHLY